MGFPNYLVWLISELSLEFITRNAKCPNSKVHSMNFYRLFTLNINRNHWFQIGVDGGRDFRETDVGRVIFLVLGICVSLRWRGRGSINFTVGPCAFLTRLWERGRSVGLLFYFLHSFCEYKYYFLMNGQINADVIFDFAFITLKLPTNTPPSFRNKHTKQFL